MLGCRPSERTSLVSALVVRSDEYPWRGIPGRMLRTMGRCRHPRRTNRSGAAQAGTRVRWHAMTGGGIMGIWMPHLY